MNIKVYKELFILLLLLIVVIFTLGMLFYDSINVDVQKIDETALEDNSKDIDDIINETNIGNNNDRTINISKSVTKEDLETYRKQNSYDTGKKNPFSGVSDSKTTEEINDIDNDTKNNENSNSNDKASNTNSEKKEQKGGRFFENKSSK